MSSANTPRFVKTLPPEVLQRYFEISLYLMVCMGFATLALTGQVGSVAVVMVSLAVAFRGYLLLGRSNWLVGEHSTLFSRWGTWLFTWWIIFYSLPGSLTPPSTWSYSSWWCVYFQRIETVITTFFRSLRF